VDEKLDMTWQCALTAQKANHTLGCIKSSVTSRAKEGILLLCSVLVKTPPGVLHPALEPSAQQSRSRGGHKNVPRAGAPLL